MNLAILILLSNLSASATETDVVGKMMEQQSSHQAGYTNQRRYTLHNKSRHAPMLVRATTSPDGVKHFEIVEESGSGAVRKHVFHKMLEEEANASRPELRERARISSENYTFRVVGTEELNGRLAYAMEVTPKNDSKYLIAGKIWVDADDYAVVRVEGKPSKNPSFWTRSVHFVHNYAKTGPSWYPVSNQSVSDVRVFGKTELTIEYFDYLPNTLTGLLQ